MIDRDGDVVGVYDKYQPTVRDLGNPAMDVRPVTTATVRINTNCRVVHLDFNEAKLAAAKKKYGSRLAYRYEGRTGVVTVLSTDPALPVDQALAEFEIENWRDYAARSAAARKAKLPDAAPAARP